MTVDLLLNRPQNGYGNHAKRKVLLAPTRVLSLTLGQAIFFGRHEHEVE